MTANSLHQRLREASSIGRIFTQYICDVQYMETQKKVLGQQTTCLKIRTFHFNRYHHIKTPSSFGITLTHAIAPNVRQAAASCDTTFCAYKVTIAFFLTGRTLMTDGFGLGEVG